MGNVTAACGSDRVLEHPAFFLARSFLLLKQSNEFLINLFGGPDAQRAVKDLVERGSRKHVSFGQDRFQRLWRANIMEQPPAMRSARSAPVE